MLLQEATISLGKTHPYELNTRMVTHVGLVLDTWDNGGSGDGQWDPTHGHEGFPKMIRRLPKFLSHMELFSHSKIHFLY